MVKLRMKSIIPCSLFPVPCIYHAVQSHSRPALHVRPHLDAVDHAALDKIFQSPGQVLRGDAEHGGAETAGIVEGDDPLALCGEAAGHAVDQVNLSADGE